MADAYDIVVVGGGHNGLTAGCYLAKQGLSVLVLERRDIIGGGAMTEDFPGAPGWRHNTHAQLMFHVEASPAYADLELPNYGLEIITLDPQIAHVFADGPPIVFYRDVDRTCESIAYYSKRDAQTYRELWDQLQATRTLTRMGMGYRPAPPSTLQAALENSLEGLEYLRQQQSTPEHVARELFETEQMRAYIMANALQGGLTSDRYGGGTVIHSMISLANDPVYGFGVAKGGTNSVARAMQRHLEAHGGTVVTGAHVDRILVSGDRATGVRLSDGSEIVANQAVIAGAGHWQLIFNLVAPEDWPPPSGDQFVSAVKRFRPDEMVIFTTHIALKEAPQWVGSDQCPDVNRAVGVYWGLDDARMVSSQVNDVREQRTARYAGGLTCTHSLADPSFNPSGGHSTFVWQMSVYDVDGDANEWDRRWKQEFGEQIVQTWRKYAPNLNGDNVVATAHYSPLDLERRTISMYRGSMAMGDAAQDQMGIFRPAPGWSDNRTPLTNLYVAAGTCYPLGGISGAPGRFCALSVVEDLGQERWWADYLG